MKSRKFPFKAPTIIRGELGDWHIQYFYERPDAPGHYKKFKVRKGINRIKDPAEKELEIRQLCADVEGWLKAGNSPFNAEEQVLQWIEEQEKQIAEEKQKSKSALWTLQEAIANFRSFIKKQGYAERSVQTYEAYVSDLEEWLTETSGLERIASAFTEYDAIGFLDDLSDENEWSGRTYNNYLKFYGTFFNRCQKLEKAVHRSVKYDFDISDVDFKITKAQRNRAYTPVLAKKIKEQLNEKGRQALRDFVEWIYLSMMRPREIRELKISHIDESVRQIRIVGKTGDRLIPISDQLLRLIQKRGLLGKNPSWYVFSKSGEAGPSKAGRDAFSSRYLAIKKALNLDHDYTMYSWKHTSVINMIGAGFKDEEIMVLSGHKTKDAFEAYKRDLVIDNSHVMKGATIEF